ncbi:MAG: luciferase family protein [Thermoplasmata archaeon]
MSAGIPPALLALDKRLIALPGVRKGTSRFEGTTAYFLGSTEIAHLHGRREVDLRLTREIIHENRERLADDPRVVFRKSRSDWVALRIQGPADVEFVCGWFEQAWRAHQ